MSLKIGCGLLAFVSKLCAAYNLKKIYHYHNQNQQFLKNLYLNFLIHQYIYL